MHLQPIFIFKFVFEITKKINLCTPNLIFEYPDILAEMTSEVTTRDVKMEYSVILKEVKPFFVVFVNDNFVCSLVY